MFKPHFKLQYMWLNIYRRHNTILAGGMYFSRTLADSIAKEHRLACVRVLVPVPHKRGDLENPKELLSYF